MMIIFLRLSGEEYADWLLRSMKQRDELVSVMKGTKERKLSSGLYLFKSYRGYQLSLN